MTVASHQFVRSGGNFTKDPGGGNFTSRLRAADPLWYRVGETVVALAIIASNMFSDALEDAAARISKRLHHR